MKLPQEGTNYRRQHSRTGQTHARTQRCHHCPSLTQEFGLLPNSHQSDILAPADPSDMRRLSPSNGGASASRKIDWTDAASASAVAFSALPPRTTGNWGRRPSLSSSGRKRMREAEIPSAASSSRSASARALARSSAAFAAAGCTHTSPAPATDPAVREHGTHSGGLTFCYLCLTVLFRELDCTHL